MSYRGEKLGDSSKRVKVRRSRLPVKNPPRPALPAPISIVAVGSGLSPRPWRGALLHRLRKGLQRIARVLPLLLATRQESSSPQACPAVRRALRHSNGIFRDRCSGRRRNWRLANPICLRELPFGFRRRRLELQNLERPKLWKQFIQKSEKALAWAGLVVVLAPFALKIRP